MEIKDLIGKTIAHAEQLEHVKYDDNGWLRLRFTDGTACVIMAYYIGYSGYSIDEYPTRISVCEGLDDSALRPVDDEGLAQ